MRCKLNMTHAAIVTRLALLEAEEFLGIQLLVLPEDEAADLLATTANWFMLSEGRIQQIEREAKRKVCHLLEHMGVTSDDFFTTTYTEHDDDHEILTASVQGD